MPLLVEPDATTSGVLAGVLPAGSHVVDRGEDVHAWLSGRGDHAVVLGPTLDLDVATGLAEAVRLTHPATAVVLLRHDLVPELYARALASGIAAVVAADDHSSLHVALARAKQAYEVLHGGPAVAPEGRVLTVFSPKGGVGKTTTTVNLAVALTRLGARVCVVDLDLAFGDVAITLQLIPTHTIAEAADSEADLDDALLQSLLTRHASGLSVLAAPTHPEGRDRVSAPLVRRIVQTLRARFDFVVVDSAPGFDDQLLGALDETDECLVVATLDVPTVKNVKVALETLDLLHLVTERRHLVLNRADDEVGLTVAAVEGILSATVAAAFPSAVAVAAATNNGEPIVSAHPDHPVSVAVTGLAQRLMGHHGEPVTPPAKRGLFGRGRRKVA